MKEKLLRENRVGVIYPNTENRRAKTLCADSSHSLNFRECTSQRDDWNSMYSSRHYRCMTKIISWWTLNIPANQFQRNRPQKYTNECELCFPLFIGKWLSLFFAVSFLELGFSIRLISSHFVSPVVYPLSNARNSGAQNRCKSSLVFNGLFFVNG